MTKRFYQAPIQIGLIGLIAITCSGGAHAVTPTSTVTPIYKSEQLVYNSPYYALHHSSLLIEQEKYAEAIPYLREAVEKDPVNLFVNYSLGLCYLEVAKQLSENSDDVPNADKRVQALLSNAEFYFNRSLDLNDELSVVYFKLGKIALMQNDQKKAIDAYQNGLAIDPENAALEFNIARVFDQQENAPKAIEHYNRAITLEPGFIYAYNNLGLIYEAQKNYKAAEKVYREALKQDKTYNFARLNLGNLYAETERYQDAKAIYLEALKYEPDNSWAHLYLGNLFFMDADYATASVHYQAAIKSNPGYTMAYYLLAVSLSKQEKVDEALSASLNYMNRDPYGKYADQMKQMIVSLKLRKTGGLYIKDATQPVSNKPL